MHPHLNVTRFLQMSVPYFRFTAMAVHAKIRSGWDVFVLWAVITDADRVVFYCEIRFLFYFLTHLFVYCFCFACKALRATSFQEIY